MNIDIEKYRDHYFNTVRMLLDVPSPTGYSREILPVLKEAAEREGCLFRETAKGCCVITLQGRDHTRSLGACAHADTLGAMVRSILPSGDLAFTRVGGALLPTLDGEYCTVITRSGTRFTGTILSKSPAVHVFPDASDRPRDEENMYVRLDECVKTPDDTRKLGIRPGDYIAFDPNTRVTPSLFLKSRFIDDKASVAALLTVAHILYEEDITLDCDAHFLITMYEEVGHGASWVPEGIESMLGVDMGCIGSDLSCTEHDVSICAKDSHGPYDYALTSRLVELAEDNGLSYAVDIYPRYGSDVDAMWTAGYDIPGALIGTGVHASHGMERTHWDGIRNTISLIMLYLNADKK